MRSVGVKPGEDLTVIAACFGERLERAWLVELEARDTALSLTFVDSRVALIRQARALRPRVVLLPLRDMRGLPSAPLITRLREHAPNVRVLLLIAPGSSLAGLAEAIRAGGETLTLGAGEDLRSVLYRTDGLGPLSVRERDATRALLAAVHPAALREILHVSVMHAHRRLSEGDLAAEMGISTRTLARQARASFWPELAEMIDWGRLLRASLLQWHEPPSLAALAHAAGFNGTRALQGTAGRLLHRSGERPGDLSPLLVSTRLQCRVKRVARAVTG